MGHRRDTLNSACQSESAGLSRSGLRKYDPVCSAVLHTLCKIIHVDNVSGRRGVGGVLHNPSERE